MPILTLKLSDDALSVDATSLAQALTTLSKKVLHKRADVTSVVLQRVAYDAWWIDGARPLQVRAQLDIRITQGTNTEDEKTRFVESAYVRLDQSLKPNGTLHPTCYITVQEVAATDWGYGGLTQHQRRMAASVTYAK